MRDMAFAEAKIFVSFIFVMGLSWFADLVRASDHHRPRRRPDHERDCYFRDWEKECSHSAVTIKSLMAPPRAIPVPIFFVPLACR